MTFTCFKGSGKIPSKKDKLTMRQSSSDSSFLKFLRITGDMVFGPIALSTLIDFITFSISSGFAGCMKKAVEVKNLSKWLAMAYHQL